MDFDRYDHIRPIRWQATSLSLLDQRKLPFSVEYVECLDSHGVSQAIRSLIVRGAPAIGIGKVAPRQIRPGHPSVRQRRPPEVRAGQISMGQVGPSEVEVMLRRASRLGGEAARVPGSW